MNMTPLQRFWALLKPDKTEIRNVYVYAIFNGLVSLSLPLGIQAIVNFIQGGRLNTAWIVLVVIVVLGVAITGVLQIFQVRITENLQQKIFTRAAFEFAYRIPRIRMESLYRHYAPELMNRFFDIVSVQKGLSKILIDFSAALLQIIFGLILLSLYHPFFVLFGLVLVLLVYGIFRLTAKPGLETSLRESKYKYKVAHWLEELARTGTTFKLAGRTDLPLRRTNDHVGDYLEARESHFKILVQQYSLLVVFKVLVAMGLLAIGGILVMEQLMNIGQFVAAEIIILLIMASVEKLILSTETIYDVLTALEKVGQVTDLELENEGGVDPITICDENGMAVRFDKVSFRYPGQKGRVLRDISLDIRSGEKIVVTGRNGSGKSSLLHVMAGLYDVEDGIISYGGLPMGNLEQSILRNTIGDYLTQEKLFEGTILENIQMGRKPATFENVRRIVEKLGLAEFIQSLPEGYNTQIDSEGKKLPRSIVEKILLARSIADKPKLLLLEDSFEHLDEADRRKIIDFLVSDENSWTLVAVSSNRYLAEKADKVIRMTDGYTEEIELSENLKVGSHA